MLIDEREIEADLYANYVGLLIAVVTLARGDADGSMTARISSSSRHVQDARLFLEWAQTDLAAILRPSSPTPRGRLRHT